MKQISLATTGFELVTKRTRKREFLDEMNLVIPWSQLLGLITPHAPAGKTGRPPFATEVMLRIHLLQQFFGHSDPVVKEALHDIPLYSEFANLHAGIIRMPDESTALRFRHILEQNDLVIQFVEAYIQKSEDGWFTLAEAKEALRNSEYNNNKPGSLKNALIRALNTSCLPQKWFGPASGGWCNR